MPVQNLYIKKISFFQKNQICKQFLVRKSCMGRKDTVRILSPYRQRSVLKMPNTLSQHLL